MEFCDLSWLTDRAARAVPMVGTECVSPDVDLLLQYLLSVLATSRAVLFSGVC